MHQYNNKIRCVKTTKKMKRNYNYINFSLFLFSRVVEWKF